MHLGPAHHYGAAVVSINWPDCLQGEQAVECGACGWLGSFSDHSDSLRKTLFCSQSDHFPERQILPHIVTAAISIPRIDDGGNIGDKSGHNRAVLPLAM